MHQSTEQENTEQENPVSLPKRPGAFFARRRVWILIVCAVVLLAGGGVAWKLLSPAQPADGPVDPIQPAAEPVVDAPEAVLGVRLDVEEDLGTQEGWQDRADAAVKAAYEAGFNCLIVPLYTQSGAICSGTQYAMANGTDYLKYLVSAAHSQAMLLYVSADPLLAPDGDQYDLCRDEDIRRIGDELADICSRYGTDGVLLTPSAPKDGNPSYTSYTAMGGSMGYESYARLMLELYVGKVAREIRTAGGGVCVGAVSPFEQREEALLWAKDGAVDFVTVACDATPYDAETFGAEASAWLEDFRDEIPLYMQMPVSGVRAGTITAADVQSCCEYLIQADNGGLLFDSFSVVTSQEKGMTALRQYISGLADENYGIRKLSVHSPSSHSFETYSDTVSFIGASDPNYPLTVNGEEVERTATGYFSLDIPLAVGKNTITLVHKDVTEVYTVTYNKVLIKSIYPSGESYYPGEASVTVSVVAYAGCTIKARLGSEVVTMSGGEAVGPDDAEAFVNYAATFTMPKADVVPVEVGDLIITAARGGESETKSGGKIFVRAAEGSANPNDTPPSTAYESGYGIQVGVGDRYVAEVTTAQTETLDIITPTDERSRPTNAYLPQGTVDYCNDTDIIFHNPESGNTNSFRNLDYGKRVYSDKNIKIFKATLPETNTVTAVKTQTDARYTTVTFDVAWKAPFQVTLAPQSYANPYPSSGRPDYSVTETTYTYVEIEFCYTVSGQGKVDLGDNNPVFRSAEWVRCESGNYGLRLWLKTPGKFYGWTAEYNKDNQLIFTFLNPYQVTEANNAYGYSLEGAVIVIDAGHGGSDCGAIGSSKQYTEAVLNLILARKIQRELENLGATVVMTRGDDSRVSLESRANLTTQIKPDLFVSVHRNASTNTAARGYENFYFYPYSKALGDAVGKRTAPNFTVDRGVTFYPFYVCRVSCCPSILTENGFVTNQNDLEMIKSDSHNNAVAAATVAGIVDYLASLKQE